jgi:hypothetical protein
MRVMAGMVVKISIHKTALTVPSGAAGAIALQVLATDGARANFGIAALPLVIGSSR